MRCPYCGRSDSKVTDSRDTEDGVRRRRQCLSCGQRFTTYERLQLATLFVVKKDGRREEFSRDKLLAGLRKACEKRPLPAGTVEAAAAEIESALLAQGLPEVSTRDVGEMVMRRLRALDLVAYIRFASVYREFRDLADLLGEVERLANEQAPAAGPGQLPLFEAEPPRGHRARPIARRGRPRKTQQPPAPAPAPLPAIGTATPAGRGRRRQARR